MQTIPTDDLVSTSFEPCSGFGPAGDGSPVCAGCGWLEGEHDHEHHDRGAAVHVLPARPAARRTPKRLAS